VALIGDYVWTFSTENILLYRIKDEKLHLIFEVNQVEFDSRILKYRFQLINEVYVLFTITEKKIIYWWTRINYTGLHRGEFTVKNMKVKDIAWVKTEDSDCLLLIARDPYDNLQRGLSKFSKPTDSVSFSWESLEDGFPEEALRYEVLDISQDFGWLLCITSESDITILNGVYPSKNPCPERSVGNSFENNSSALGCIRKATRDTVAGVLSYFKYQEFGFFELQKSREIERDSGDDEISSSSSEDSASNDSAEANEENDKEIWEQDSY